MAHRDLPAAFAPAPAGVCAGFLGFSAACALGTGPAEAQGPNPKRETEMSKHNLESTFFALSGLARFGFVVGAFFSLI